jgi:CRP/FNR family transcriptional regulator, cyclic AMP receptor protein
MEKSSLFEKFGTVFEAGRVIFQEGEPGDTMYIIQKGRVKITKKVDEVDKILMVLGKGDFFGEMAIISQTPRTAAATAIDNCETLAFNRNGFISMISKNSNIAMNIIEKLCTRIEKADNQIRDLAKRDLKSLVISSLNDLRRATKQPGEPGPARTLNYSETVRNISLQISATTKDVEGELERLASTGYLETEGNTIRIVKTEDLDKLAGYFNK